VIDGVIITPLKQIHDERGAVYHMLRSDSPNFVNFGELYFSVVNPGIAKGWNRHKKMITNLSVIKGKLALVLVDLRSGSSTEGEVQEIILGSDPDIYQLVTVPNMIWTGSKCLSDEPAILANCASIPHDPEEAEKLFLKNSVIPYDWS
jgi:dTDP-4-dehydrorhamnose 3,5-epimerase